MPLAAFEIELPSAPAEKSRGIHISEVLRSDKDVEVGPNGEFISSSRPDVSDLMDAHGLVGEFPSFWHDPICWKDFEADTLRKALPRVSVSLSFWTIGLFFNNLSQAWLQQHMAGYYESKWAPKPPEKQSVILWDVGFYALPTIRSTAIVDVFAGAFPALMFIRFMVLPGPLSMRWTILARLFLIWGALWALRGLTIISTVLPNPDQTCKPKLSFPNSMFMEALANMPFVFWRHEMTCLDVLFSGHTVALTLATLLLLHYMAWAPWFQCSTSPGIVSGAFLFKTIAIINMFIGYYVIIASKFHYTSDVLMGFMMTVMTFRAYHLAVRVTLLSSSSRHRFLRCSVAPFLRWFEEDALDVAILKVQLQRQ